MIEESDHEMRTDFVSGALKEVPRANVEEVGNAMKKMKKGKAVGPDKIPGKA